MTCTLNTALMRCVDTLPLLLLLLVLLGVVVDPPPPGNCHSQLQLAPVVDDVLVVKEEALLHVEQVLQP